MYIGYQVTSVSDRVGSMLPKSDRKLMGHLKKKSHIKENGYGQLMGHFLIDTEKKIAMVLDVCETFNNKKVTQVKVSNLPKFQTS